jgi:hypothetical protein
MGKQTVGYRYGLELHFGLSHPVDALLEVRVADRTAWSGELTSNDEITINKPDLLGGDEKEGGIVGTADVMFGRDTQMPNSYLASLFAGLMPAFRGMMGFVWKGGQVTANNPYIKPWSFKVRRINEGWGETQQEGNVYQGQQLFHWEVDDIDPRNCSNDHEYSFQGFYLDNSGKTVWDTEANTMAAAQAHLGFSLGPLAGFNASGGPNLNGYGYSNPAGEDLAVTLHYLPTTPAIYANASIGGQLSGNLFALFDGGGIALNTPFFWNGAVPSGTFVAQRPGIWVVKAFSDPDPLPDIPGYMFHMNNGLWPEVGYVAFLFFPTIYINVRRKPRPPDDPCAPKCTPAWPDWEEDSNFCVVGDQLVEKINWTEVSGNFKALALYQHTDTQEYVLQYPLEPVIDENHADYNDEAYWTALYNVAVDAGQMPAGLTYNPSGTGNYLTYPRRTNTAYLSDVTTVTVPDIWEPDLARIGDDMNPAHILYQAHTNGDWAMGWPRALIGDTFATAAETLYNEGFGLSFFWTQQEKIDVFCQIVLDHIAGVIYPNRRTGQFELKLIRDDYDPDTLEEFDPGNILEMQSFQRGGYGETVNEVIVIYTNPLTGKDIATPPGQDMANIRAQGGAVITRKIHYPGITSAELALRVRDRELIAGSTPLAKGRIVVDRTAWAVVAGDVRKLTWPIENIEGLVVRVLDVKYGTLLDGAITVDFAEDVWGLRENSFGEQQSPQWVDPTTEPEPLTQRVVEEASYYDLRRRLDPANLAILPDDSGYLLTTAVRIARDNIDYAIRTHNGTAFVEVARGDYCPSGVLSGPLGLPTDSGINTIDLDAVVDGDLVQLATCALVGTELVRIDAWNWDATTRIGHATIGRGVLDTVAIAHTAGTRIYFLDSVSDTDGVQRVDGETVQVKLLPRTIQGELDVDDATADSVTFDSRMFRPYPPGRPRLNGELYPVSLFEVAITVDWAHRDRLLQNLEGEETGSIGPEDGTTYKLRFVDHVTETELYLAEGITADSHLVSPSINGIYTLRMELSSVRDGVESRQKQTHVFYYINGDYRITEDGFRRYLEGDPGDELIDRLLED